MTKSEKQAYQKLSRKCRFCLILSLGLVLASSLAKIIVSNRSATWGKNLESLQAETDKIIQDNSILKSELSQNIGGLITISEQAFKQGFTDKPQVKYLNHDWKLAAKSN
ncbi:MAG: hypothetical protein NTZ93_00385 [Candidatus Beckwithbacteria bacterium]|nr:hypothetical protein [Candidatus Beckwithbacteria bacterium]